jgi:hypothetical protein
MGFHVLLLAFAVVIVGGMGNPDRHLHRRHGARPGDRADRALLLAGADTIGVRRDDAGPAQDPIFEFAPPFRQACLPLMLILFPA